MFTGIIEAAVPVTAIESRGTGARLVLPSPKLQPDAPHAWNIKLGDSIAVSGACLTVAEIAPDGSMSFDLSKETLDRTRFGAIQVGHRVNLERAMILGSRLDGHMVSGHVDGGGELTARTEVGDGGAELHFRVDEGLDRYLIEKGSVTLDGVSLTVVEPRDAEFRVACIPLTLELTNLGTLTVGSRINVEADLIGKWVERLR
jgi:riboflavin synthase